MGSINNDTVMARLILIICAIGVVGLLLRRFMPRRPARKQNPGRDHFTSTVRCHVCGAYLDRRLAREDTHGYCCDSHDQNP
ncbi:hypothetical protein [Salinisphaera sp.]|uniref:hypothetical protein n=1 Tax=Salinisphaera sp. TaxID=1914330 RepID=UPI002D781153|nr:hypothetical protein [Salinisphaera sp.]HET7313177.1 hypothetical protein [Salinisphaera sp.]